jgi:hypothetical protein
VNTLDAAVQLMGAQAYATKKFVMPKDYYRTKHLIKQYRQAIQILLRGLVEKKAARRNAFENAFITAAKMKLTGEVFEMISAEARRIAEESQTQENA